MTLSPDSRAELFARVADDTAWICFDEVRPLGLTASELRIVLEPDEGRKTFVARFSAADGDSCYSLARWSGQIVKIVLRVVASAAGSGSGSGSGWEIAGPSIKSKKAAGNLVADPSSDPSDGEAQARSNIIIYLADALRRDSVGVYGAEQSLTPEVDRFAARATVYEDCVAHSPWTRPSVVSIFTGLEPHRHGVNDDKDTLATATLTAAEILSASGYFTAAAITNGNIGPEFAVTQGFDVVSTAQGKLSSAATTDRALEILESPELREPFFLYVHNLDPHHPYDINEEASRRFAAADISPDLGTARFLQDVRLRKRVLNDDEKTALRSIYDDEVAYMDQEFGRFLLGVRDLGFFADSVIVFVSDHGEEFWDHDRWGHGISLYNELINIPRIIKAPFQEQGARVNGLVRQVDVFPTLLDYARIKESIANAGQPLPQTGSVGGRLAYSVLDKSGRNAVSISDGEWKLILLGKERKRRLLFYLGSDRLEKQNLVNRRPVVAGYMESLLRAKEDDDAVMPLAGPEAELSEDLKDQLRAIGYLQ
jgi:arylsulfatase A-like enzyme